jgi:hypothetical protein
VAFLSAGNADKHALALQMVSVAGTAAAFLWPLPARKKSLATAFPRRGEDMRLLLNLDENRTASLKLLRDSVIHLDERIEEQFLMSSKPQMTMWTVTETELGDGAHFAWWNPVTQVFGFLDNTVHIPELIETLELIQRRAAAAFLPMLGVVDIEDELEAD